MSKYTCGTCGKNCESEEGCVRHKKRKPLKRSGASLSDKEDTEKQFKLFLEIWSERLHKSEISGQPIYGEALSVYFDHLLEKSKYPELKFDKKNIVIVTSEEHESRHNGFPVPKHKELIDKAFEELL
jgi:hypothetical protein